MFSFALSYAEAWKIAKKVAHSICTGETRYYLNGFYVHKAGDGNHYAVSTDGHRLTRIRIEPTYDPDAGEFPADMAGNSRPRAGPRHPHDPPLEIRRKPGAERGGGMAGEAGRENETPMTNEKYRPVKLDDALSRIAEECSEVIKIVCKAQRFGLNDTHPAKGRRNIELLKEELADIETAAADFFRILGECQPSNPNPSDEQER